MLFSGSSNNVDTLDFCDKCRGYNGIDDKGICRDCGVMQDGLDLVTAVEFTPGGRAQGQLTRSTQVFKPGQIVNTRYDRLKVGETHIRRIANALDGLNDNMVTKANATYRLAITNNFMKKGRPAANVAGVCIYTACRLNRFPILMIDISRILQVNVFSLGRLCSKLCKALNVKLGKVPLLAALGSNESLSLDPSLYLIRFARKLEFGKKTQRVELLATQILQCMQNDWIQCGRHPAGLFGASLVIAAKLLGFHRTFREVSRIVSIGGVTIGRRVFEFASSASGKLTLAEFEDADFGKSENPPAFKRALAQLAESEVLDEDEKQWHNKAKDAHEGCEHHETDVKLDEDELDGYIVGAESTDFKVKSQMHATLFDDFYEEQQMKKVEKEREKEKKKDDRKRKRGPSARKKNAEQLQKLALSDASTAPLLPTLHSVEGKIIKGCELEDLEMDDFELDDFELDDFDPEVVAKKQKKVHPYPAKDDSGFSSDSSSTIPDVSAEMRDLSGDDSDDLGYESAGDSLKKFQQKLHNKTGEDDIDDEGEFYEW